MECPPDLQDNLKSRGALQSSNGIVGILGLEVAVKEQRAVARSPRVLVANTPDSDTDTLLGVQAGIGNLV